MNKNICFFCGNVERTGGTERVMTVIANQLVDRGYAVSILSLIKGEHSFFDLDSRIKLSSLNMEGKSSNFSNYEIIKKLRKFLKEHNVDYIVDVDVILSFYSVFASVGITTKVISWEHFHYHSNVGDLGQRIKRTLARKLAIKFSKYIVTLTEKDRLQYIENNKYKDKIISIANPLTINNVVKSNLDKKIVLAVGRLCPQKGFDLLLKSWVPVSKVHPEWKLLIVGSGDDYGSLCSLTKELNLTDTIEFLPATKNVSRYFLDASIYVMSSRFEGLPLVLIEAKAHGLPIVSFDCNCGPSDIIRDGVDGILVERENTSQLAKGLVDLMGDKDKRGSLGDKAFLDDRFEVPKVVERWVEILK